MPKRTESTVGVSNRNVLVSTQNDRVHRAVGPRSALRRVMSLAFLILFVTLLFMGLVPYFAYPFLLRGFRLRSAGGKRELPKKISILVPAHNEAGVIRSKLESSLALVLPEGVDREIIVCSDGSTDGTDDLVLGMSGRGVRLFRHDARRGKSAAIRTLLHAASGDWVLLTDASAHLDPNALLGLIGHIGPEVGLVSPTYRIRGDARQDRAWMKDTKVRRAASDRGVLFGAHGAAVLLRRAWLPNLSEETINDDFQLPLAMVSRGARCVYTDQVFVWDRPTVAASADFRRRARIASGNLQMIWDNAGLLGNPRIAVPLLLHKGLKTLSPITLGLLAVLAALSSPQSLVMATVAAIMWSSVLLGLTSLALQSIGLRLGRFEALGRALAAASGVAYGVFRTLLKGPQKRWAPAEVEAGPGQAPIPSYVLALKRIIDIAGALVGIVLTAPLMALTAIAIRLESPGPVIFRQSRATYRRGRETTFTMMKFRSMRSDAETRSGPVWAQKEDPRVTKVGRWIRATRIDELPQLFNVLAGDMSLVGPRPERPFFVEQLRRNIPAYDDRMVRAKPGITGWAQVHQGYDTSVESVRTKLSYDLAYVAHLYSVREYLGIEARTIVKTLGVMVGRRGAH